MPETDETPADRPGASVPGSAETALLHDLIRWREQLARSIARNNLSFRSGQITTAVNRILFPLILLAVAEDRRLLPAGTLALLRDLPDKQYIPVRLGRFADEMYAGEILDAPRFSNPAGSPVLEERVIRSILEDMAAPDRCYDFQRISIASLGQVLTQYLARTVRRSAAHHAGVVDTHDTVLSGGTVIPPLILIQSMADQALDTARKNRSKKEILPLRILDPACGSGTVLVVAYRNLIRTAAEPDLTFEERREILVHSIHGVDTSPHAVAAARMLLVLELLENHPPCGEPGILLTLVQPVFWDLRHTILCGNALISPDITRDESWNFCPPRGRGALNLFSWNDHFTEVRAAGGFDVVLCNPPEGAVEAHEWIQQYFQRHFFSYLRAADRFVYFVEKGLSLLRTGGTLAFVMSSRWLRGTGGSSLRGLLKNRRIEEIAEHPSAGLC
ncbi:MAG: Eco57I restriction-modification methylase domain-containing protein, partial [Methanoregula sp.]|nr:Eco57I restriction-modification methylase domain-containing protein [Methanoregula sp.]